MKATPLKFNPPFPWSWDEGRFKRLGAQSSCAEAGENRGQHDPHQQQHQQASQEEDAQKKGNGGTRVAKRLCICVSFKFLCQAEGSLRSVFFFNFLWRAEGSFWSDSVESGAFYKISFSQMIEAVNHRVLQGAAQRGAQFYFIYGSPGPFMQQSSGSSKPIVWGTHGLHLRFPWFSSFSWFPWFRWSSTQILVFICLSCLCLFRRFRDVRRFRARRPACKP